MDLRKSGISGNAKAIEVILEVPRHLQKPLAFPEVLGHFGKFVGLI